MEMEDEQYGCWSKKDLKVFVQVSMELRTARECVVKTGVW